MASPSFEVKGLKELGDSLKALDRMTQGRVLDASLLAAAEPIRAEAERLTPRSDTPGGSTGKGHAADHIASAVQPGRSLRTREVDIGPEAPFWYLIFPELGTPNQSAVAMFRRAADGKFDEAVERFRDIMAIEVGKAI